MSNKTLLRVIVLLGLSVVLMLIGRYSPLSGYFSMDGLHQVIINAGPYGVLLFVLLYIVGILMNIPGVLFLMIGFMLYGGIYGFAVVYLASFSAVAVHFYFLRFMAGEALKEVKHPFVLKQMAKLEGNPIRTMIILRIIFYVSPPVNYALAFSSIKARVFLLGSAIALLPSILVYYGLTELLKDQWLRWVM